MLHKNVGIGDNHPTHNWEYADAAARTGATGFVAGDVHKLALQLDDLSLWILVSTTPTWQQFGTGVSTFLGLTDSPSSYSGQAGKVVAVNATADALEFITGGGSSYTDEQAQDAVGGILTDSTTVDFTYDDTGNTITAATKQQMSITSDASGLKLSGDSASPGNNKVYGTDASGVKGWKNDPAGGGSGQTSIQFQDEGSALGSSGTVDIINFTGSGVVATRVGNTLSVTITAAASSFFGLQQLISVSDLNSFSSITPLYTLVNYI